MAGSDNIYLYGLATFVHQPKENAKQHGKHTSAKNQSGDRLHQCKPAHPFANWHTCHTNQCKGSYSGLQDLYNCINLNFSNKLCFGLAYEEYLTNPRNATGEELLTKIHIPIK